MGFHALGVIMDPRTRLLLDAPIGPTLLRLAAPNVVVMVAQASIGLVETYFVAALGTDALAGMALVFPVLMLVQMMSAGAMGGGILSAVARALGSGRAGDADALVWHAVVIAIALGCLTSLATLSGGAALYRAMGGSGASLVAANAYSATVFAGAVLIWLFNSLAAVIRGTGNMALPAAVTAIGVVVITPLSPALIMGYGPLPALGIIGGGVAILLYYGAGAAVFAAYLWSGRGVLQPAMRPPRLRWSLTRDILRIGLVSSVVSVSTNAAIAVATGLVGVAGPAALAGYGTGARLEYLLVPLVFGLGAPLAAMVGTSIGAGQHARALRVAWTGAAIAFLLTEAIGLAAALSPETWLRLFDSDPAMLAVGTRYLQIVGPAYGFFGGGLALYFASQGAGRLGWPLIGAVLRVGVAVAGGFLAIAAGLGITGVFVALAGAMVVFSLVVAGSIAAGAWFGPAGHRAGGVGPLPEPRPAR
jgi:putative MATE family efflux protein